MGKHPPACRSAPAALHRSCHPLKSPTVQGLQPIFRAMACNLLSPLPTQIRKGMHNPKL